MNADKGNIKIRRFLLYAGIAFVAAGILFLLLDISWMNTVYTKTDALRHRQRESNGWGFILVGGGLLFARFYHYRKL